MAAHSPGQAPQHRRRVRVLCVDDHALLIDGLKAQFEIEGRIGLVAALSSAEGLLEVVAAEQPDAVLMDVEMPGPDAFETADRLHHMYPRVRIIFLSAHIRDAFISAAYRCGASGYFAKSDEPAQIVAGITEAVRGPGSVFIMGPKVRAHCRPAPTAVGGRRLPEKDRTASPPTTPIDRLTPREAEIVRLIGQGRSRTEIAAELCRSAKTIDGHQDRILRKLGLSSRAELMRLAIREGLAEA